MLALKYQGYDHQIVLPFVVSFKPLTAHFHRMLSDNEDSYLNGEYIVIPSTKLIHLQHCGRW